jgi:hypothetical protein
MAESPPRAFSITKKCTSVKDVNGRADGKLSRRDHFAKGDLAPAASKE